MADNMTPNSTNVSVNNNAKFTFIYLLSLVALIFTALGSGMIIFQIINRLIVDKAMSYAGYTDEAMRFGIASVLVAAPIYFFTTRHLLKSLASGVLAKNSAVRRWLSYLILFVAAVIIIAWLIGTINMFLSGELTTKFVLKFLTVLVISGLSFGYYFFDIKREDFKKHDVSFLTFAIAGLVVALGSFIASWFFVDSPQLARARRFDQQVVTNLNLLENAIENYNSENKNLPEALTDLTKSSHYYISDSQLKDSDGNMIEYKKVDVRKYQLCSNFKTKTDSKQDRNMYGDERYKHEIGHFCFDREVGSAAVNPKEIKAQATEMNN